MTKNAWRLVAVVALCTASGMLDRAGAVDQGITGKKFLIKTASRKLVVISKDPGISVSGSDPVGGADSLLTITGFFPFQLPTTHWTTNASGTSFKYRNAQAPSGPSSIKIVKLRAGLLKIIEKGSTIAAPIGPATLDVVLSLDGGTNNYCMRFSGTGDGEKFLVKDATAGSCPPAPCEATTGGFCWFLGDLGADCSTTCTTHGRVYDDAGTRAFAGSDGTNANCSAVMSDLGLSFAVTANGCGSGSGCIADVATESVIRCTTPATTASASDPGGFRACACQ